jgi:ArsR family transcriptional regulator
MNVDLRSPSAGQHRGSTLVRDLDRTRLRQVAVLARALGDPVRVQLVELLRRHGGEVCQCELLARFELSQPTLSHHLGKLRDAGIVTVRRRGSWAYYQVNPDALKELTTWLS